MRNINSPNEYHKFKSTSGGSNNSGGSGYGDPGFGGWIVIIIFAYFILYFIFSGASWEVIETLIGFGIIGFMIFKWLFK